MTLDAAGNNPAATEAEKAEATQEPEAKPKVKAKRKPRKRPKTPHKQGRPSLYTPELAARICAKVRSGRSGKDAALLCGISGKTLDEWVTRGRIGEEPFAGFYRALTVARSQRLGDVEEFVHQAALHDLPTARWLLSVRRREKYSSRVELTGKGGGPVQHEVSSMSDADLAKLSAGVWPAVAGADGSGGSGEASPAGRGEPARLRAAIESAADAAGAPIPDSGTPRAR